MRFILFISCLLLVQPVFAKNLRCDQIDAFLSIGEQYHLKNPFLGEELIVKAGDKYIDILDPAKTLLTKEEHKEELSYLKKNATKILTTFYTEPCKIFSHIEGTVKKAEERQQALIIKSIKLGPKKFQDLKPIDGRLTNKTISKNVENKIRNHLFETPPADRPKIIEKISTMKSFLTGYEEKRASVITKAFYNAYDPHSEYYTDAENRQFDSSMSGSMVGIGIIFELDKKGALINSIMPNSPVKNSGKINEGDRIISINGKKFSLTDQGEEFSKLLTLPEGSKIVLQILKKDNSKTDVEIVVNRIELEDAKVSYKVFKQQNKNIVSIKVPSFYYDEAKRSGAAKDTYIAFQSAWNEADQKVDLVILDLRDNTGGLVTEALNMAGLFLGTKVIMQTKSHEAIEQLSSKGYPLIKEPLIVLTNKLSASASEIVAGALQDYNRGVLVGEKTTYGKGTMQNVLPNLRSSELGTLKITTAQFYLPKGSSTQRKGVPSDIILPSPLDTMKYNESEFNNALPWDRVESVISEEDDFKARVNLEKIKSLSKKRVEKVKEFKDFKDKTKAAKTNEALKKDKKDIVLDEAVNISLDYLASIEK